MAFEDRVMSAEPTLLELRRQKAARLLQIRTELRLSQRAVALAAGISQALYNELERAKHDLLPRHIDALFLALGDEVKKLV